MCHGHGMKDRHAPARCRKRPEGGWAVPLVCMALMAGAAVLAAALQQTLSDEERMVRIRWQSLQAQAVAEGLLSRTLALLDEAGSVDEACRVASTTPVAPAERFAQRAVKAGSTIVCRVQLHGDPGIRAWSCQCPPATAPTAPASRSSPSSTSSTSVLAQLRLEAASAPMLRAVVTAAVTEGQVPTATLEGQSGPAWQLSVLLKPDASGTWRQVVGSWNDVP